MTSSDPCATAIGLRHLRGAVRVRLVRCDPALCDGHEHGPHRRDLRERLGLDDLTVHGADGRLLREQLGLCGMPRALVLRLVP